MKSVTIRNLSDEVHRAIRQRAAAHGRSTEAEIRAILAEAVRPADRVALGSLLAGALADDDRLTVVDQECHFERDRTPHEPIEFEQ